MSVKTYEADNLIVSATTDNRYPLASGQNLQRGALLKFDGGKVTKADTADTARAILVDDTDASAGDTHCGYYVAGSVVKQAGVLLDGLDADAVYEALLGAGIVMKG